MKIWPLSFKNTSHEGAEQAKPHVNKANMAVKVEKRRQFNAEIYPGLIADINFLAITLSVPKYVITEHLLQVGGYHLHMALRDKNNEAIIREHLIQGHLLSNTQNDTPELLRIGEPNYPGELLQEILDAIRAVQLYNKALDTICNGEHVRANEATIEQCRRYLASVLPKITESLQSLEKEIRSGTNNVKKEEKDKPPAVH